MEQWWKDCSNISQDRSNKIRKLERQLKEWLERNEILAEDNRKLKTENERLIDLLWKIRREHIENKLSSYGKVVKYIDVALGIKKETLNEINK